MSVEPAIAESRRHPVPQHRDTSQRWRGIDDRLRGGLGLQVSLVAIVIVAWELIGRSRVNLAFPPVSAVAGAFLRMAGDGELAHAFASTLPPLLAGVSIAAAVGTSVGIAMGLSRPMEAIFYPIFLLLQTAPVAALIPLITEVFGVDVGAKTLAVVALSLPVVALNAYKGIRGASPSLIDMCRSLMGTRWQTVTKIVLPSAAAMIFAGLRLGVSGGFVGIVLAELLITPTGIGDLISYNSSMARYPDMYAAILSIVATATITLMTLQKVEHHLTGRRAP